MRFTISKNGIRLLSIISLYVGSSLYSFAQPDLIYLLRHAPKQTDAIDSKNPPISADGEKLAQRLAVRLKDEQISAVISSHLLRTQQTAQPTANAHQLTVTIPSQATSLTAHVDEVAALAMAQDGVVLIVGHSNTVPMLIKKLGGPPLTNLSENAYGDLFILRLTPDPTPSSKVGPKLQQERLSW
ncbi:hypothetical protein EZV61_07890 [Corallincola luteus]|uniref:Histidine phosphatase family protein n=1 Tax=Corallincola luteus TaxID=1775177 RepID=A0ABY2AQN9_9GAMM|nr:phosphoglycerate mutase family protein [Corallincola luteus]TCI04097.1 hypothetical protein EZV61_07890 [Corallincola luteus]